MSAPGVPALVGAWRTKAATLAPYAPAAAQAFSDAAAELEAALAADAGRMLSFTEAVLASGIPARTLREMLADGRVPNVGRKGKPMLRAADLPRRAALPSATAGGPYDPTADARQLAGKLRAL